MITKNKNSTKQILDTIWQGRRDSNTQPAVLETAALPLSHSPKKHIDYIIIKNFSQINFGIKGEKMKKKFKLGVIGSGFMANAIIQGVISSGALHASEIIVSDIRDEALLKIRELGAEGVKDNKYLVDNSEFVLFAVKPQNISAILEEIKGACCEKFISIMAGIKKAKIKNALGNVKVARAMPNTPCVLGSGAVGIDLSDYSDNDDVTFISNIFSSLAVVVSVPEEKLNAVTGVSGSAPAYFYLFLKGIIDAGIKHGLTYDEAKLLAVNTMIGSGKMVLQSTDKSIDELITAVCSKGGTTIEAINTYNANGLTNITEQAIDACVKRSKELENL